MPCALLSSSRWISSGVQFGRTATGTDSAVAMSVSMSLVKP